RPDGFFPRHPGDDDALAPRRRAGFHPRLPAERLPEETAHLGVGAPAFGRGSDPDPQGAAVAALDLAAGRPRHHPALHHHPFGVGTEEGWGVNRAPLRSRAPRPRPPGWPAPGRPGPPPRVLPRPGWRGR